MIAAINELTAKIEPVDLSGVVTALNTANELAASVIGDFGGEARVKTNEGP